MNLERFTQVQAFEAAFAHCGAEAVEEASGSCPVVGQVFEALSRFEAVAHSEVVITAGRVEQQVDRMEVEDIDTIIAERSVDEAVRERPVGGLIVHIGEVIPPGLPRPEIEARVHEAINKLNP